MDLTELTISEASVLITRGEITPLELTQAHLTRIEQINPKLNSFITLTSEAAIQQAEESLQRGDSHNILYGIPIALKDIFDTKGILTTAGSKFFLDHIPDADCPVVQNLKTAGAIILGKLNMHEIALGVTNDNPYFGACCNPWDLRRIPGGSSGGCAAALAARLCLGAFGSDTGGSIRIPASLCGVTGLKPTRGLVSLRGVFPVSWNLDHVGPMARSANDLAILLQTVSSYDQEDPYSIDYPRDDYLKTIKNGVIGWRVALASDAYFDDVDAEVLAAVQEAARVFIKLGAHVEKVTFPGAREAAQINRILVSSDAAAIHHERFQNQPQNFGPDIRQRLLAGAACTSTDYILAQHAQTLLRRQFESFLTHFDILLTPTTPTVAPLRAVKYDTDLASLLTRFTAPFNLTGLPALSLPCGFNREGLPIGLQIISSPWSEARLLQAANAFEQATDWNLRKPLL